MGQTYLKLLFHSLFGCLFREDDRLSMDFMDRLEASRGEVNEIEPQVMIRSMVMSCLENNFNYKARAMKEEL